MMDSNAKESQDRGWDMDPFSPTRRGLSCVEICENISPLSAPREKQIDYQDGIRILHTASLKYRHEEAM